jgi:hypothetical protein
MRKIKYVVEVEPSIFRAHESFTLGCFRWWITAWFAATWHVSAYPHSKARIRRA